MARLQSREVLIHLSESELMAYVDDFNDDSWQEYAHPYTGNDPDLQGEYVVDCCTCGCAVHPDNVVLHSNEAYCSARCAILGQQPVACGYYGVG